MLVTASPPVLAVPSCIPGTFGGRFFDVRRTEGGRDLPRRLRNGQQISVKADDGHPRAALCHRRIFSDCDDQCITRERAAAALCCMSGHPLIRESRRRSCSMFCDAMRDAMLRFPPPCVMCAVRDDAVRCRTMMHPGGVRWRELPGSAVGAGRCRCCK